MKIDNRTARRIWLTNQGFATPPTGALGDRELQGIIEGLGFVQLDTIRVVARAHDHILWSRNQHYRETMLPQLLSSHRAVFEHFTHDASVLPIEFYPYWQRQFRRLGQRMKQGRWGQLLPPARERAKIRKRIEREGPLSTKDFQSKRKKTKDGWIRPPHKFCLEYLWYAGDLSTSARKNFIKYYDLSERVIPEKFRETEIDDAEQVNWLCRAAIERLGFGSEGEIQRFWDAVELTEVKDWVVQQGRKLRRVEIETANGSWIPMLAPRNVEALVDRAGPPTSRLRIVNPFDPVVRDRARLKRLFGFDYRIEIFTPAAKRRYGYYVYPILEGDRFVGRIDVRADRKRSSLKVHKIWWEPGVKLSQGRKTKLNSELERLARFVGVKRIEM